MNKGIIISIAVLIIMAFWFLLKEDTKVASEEGKPTKRGARSKLALSDQESSEERRRKKTKQRENEIRLGIQQANVPINFWGKVVDQDGNPLEGVKITYRVGKPRVMWDTNTVVKDVTTGANGSFYIEDKGSGFSFKNFEKEGYRKTQGQRVSFTYSDNSERYSPDRTKPKIYTLIREEEIQGLISSTRQLLLNWDGVPVYYDLKKGRLGKSGEIKITAKRGEVKGIGQTARYNWSFEMEILNGGILETTQEQAFLAPEEGYKSSWGYGFLASDSDWKHRKHGNTFLFLKLPNGNYGRLKIRFSAEPGSKLSGRIYSYLNPTGGRLLEYDARQKAK